MDERGCALVVGAGIGGLTAAVDLASRGIEVMLLEKGDRVGGKMREVTVCGRSMDAGPTVLTMRHVFDEVFAAAGERLDNHLTLDPVDLLARHGWDDGSRLDLHTDIDRTADAIGLFAGAREAAGYRRFCEYSRRIHEAVQGTFLMAERPSLVSILRAIGSIGFGALREMDGMRIMWEALRDFFRDPRLLQLFGRYATYSGSSPFAAPATLNVIAHVEREGVWLVRGGMYRLAEALLALAVRLGVTVRTGAEVSEILVLHGRACGVRLRGGEEIRGRAVVCNADSGALREGLFGRPAKRAVGSPGARSLSAVTWAVVGRAEGFPLVRHNVFFSDDYAREFAELFEEEVLPRAPTVYVCAQDRGDIDSDMASPERLFCLVNAPANGDRRTLTKAEIERCEAAMRQTLSRSGLTITEAGPAVVTTPSDFAGMFPATGGALYGAASHGWTAPFSRPSARARIPGLYLCGGSAHPGAGVPMVAQSGRLAALSLAADLASTSRSSRAVMPGGMSMP